MHVSIPVTPFVYFKLMFFNIDNIVIIIVVIVIKILNIKIIKPSINLLSVALAIFSWNKWIIIVANTININTIERIEISIIICLIDNKSIEMSTLVVVYHIT